MYIKHFFDPDTFTFTYVVSDEKTSKCAIIDPVLDYQPQSGKISTYSVEKILDYIKHKNLQVEWILETHVHADHLTGAHYLKEKLDTKVGIGENIKEVLKFGVPLFNTSDSTPLDGSQFDHLFKDGEIFTIGLLEVRVMATPGHTPACISYIIGDSIFVGDTIFMPCVGTARADFPGGDAKTLYQSIQRILSLPDETRIFTCHDYPSGIDKPSCESTVAQHKADNIMIAQSISEDTYIEKRKAKDKTLPVPRLLLPSIQVNMRAGNLGNPESNQIQYIKIPLNQL